MIALPDELKARWRRVVPERRAGATMKTGAGCGGFASAAAAMSAFHQQALPCRQLQNALAARPHPFILGHLLRPVADPAVVIEHDHPTGDDTVEKDVECRDLR